MSKVGRRPIALDGAQVTVQDSKVHYKGKLSSGVHELPEFLKATVADNALLIEMQSEDRDHKKFWGLHRSLLANAILGSMKEFERNLEINGLGFKAEVSGKKVTFTLGYTHKIFMTLPEIVSLTVDKTGQKLSFKSTDKAVLGQVCATVRSYRKPEPYKGTGIKYSDEVIFRKAGKTKSK